MRTTIEMSNKHRAALLELAARRGRKGFSEIVEEALDAYLRSSGRHADARKRALSLRGALSRREAARLSRHAASLRKSWR